MPITDFYFRTHISLWNCVCR